MNTGISISAVGRGEQLDDAINRALDSKPDVIEIAVGARPCPRDPYETIHAAKASATITAHHTLPLLKQQTLRPDAGNELTIAHCLNRHGITSYTAHPPASRDTSDTGWFDWALRYRDCLGEHGIDFAVETMYTPRTPQDRAQGRWPLANEAGVIEFVEKAHQWGWDRPLLLDAAHVNIGVMHHEWTWAAATALLEQGCVHTVHLSDNDGRRDAHDPLAEGSAIHRWAASAPLDNAIYVIDEGRQL